jgi:RecA/RadA recombinase
MQQRSAQFDIDFGRGISRSGEIVDLGVATKVLSKSGITLLP